jgi:hypothetical protein
MHVRLSVWGGPGEKLLTSLQNWLQMEPGLQAAPVVREPAPPDDCLVINVPEGAGASLAKSLSTWLCTRIGNVGLRVAGPDGTAEISVANIAKHESLLREVLEPVEVLEPAGDPVTPAPG